MPAVNPLFSLIVPHYNHKEQLPLLLDTVLAQNLLPQLEVVVVDNASDESCEDVIEAYRNKGLAIQFIQHPENLGTKNSRCTGITHAQGVVLGFADADDLLYGTEALAYHVFQLLEKRADILHFNAIWRDHRNIEYISPWAAPVAPVLEGDSVFATHQQGFTMWNKLYTKELCMRHLDACKSSNVRWAAEDLYMSLWLLFHAQRYCGSERVGYYHYYQYEQVKHRHAGGRTLDIYYIITEFLPYMTAHNCSHAIRSECEAFLFDRFFMNFTLFQEQILPVTSESGKKVLLLTQPLGIQSFYNALRYMQKRTATIERYAHYQSSLQSIIKLLSQEIHTGGYSHD